MKIFYFLKGFMIKKQELFTVHIVTEHFFKCSSFLWMINIWKLSYVCVKIHMFLKSQRIEQSVFGSEMEKGFSGLENLTSFNQQQ